MRAPRKSEKFGNALRESGNLNNWFDIMLQRIKVFKATSSPCSVKKREYNELLLNKVPVKKRKIGYQHNC